METGRKIDGLFKYPLSLPPTDIVPLTAWTHGGWIPAQGRDEENEGVPRHLKRGACSQGETGDKNPLTGKIEHLAYS